MTAVDEVWLRSVPRRRRDIRYIASLFPVALPVTAFAVATARIVDGKGPIFRQIRRGRDGNPFTINKIRSQSAPGIPTDVGRILRFTSIDELPQFLNVLSGDMSLLGPRPLMPSDIEEMEQMLPLALFHRWLDAYDYAGPGCLSSFAHFARRHGRTVNRQELLEKRAELDIMDVKLSSPSYERRQLLKLWPTAVHMIRRPDDVLY